MTQESKKCSNCRFFLQDRFEKCKDGECRFNPPQVVFDSCAFGGGSFESKFPTTCHYDWCAKWEGIK
jgi:hypothetical protein